MSEEKLLRYFDFPHCYYFDQIDFSVRKVWWMRPWLAKWFAKRRLREIRAKGYI